MRPENDFQSDLDWATLGAIPERLQTAYGSLNVGLDARPGQSLLIRGGTSSVGMATAVLAKQQDMTVLSTTRNPAKSDARRHDRTHGRSLKRPGQQDAGEDEEILSPEHPVLLDTEIDGHTVRSWIGVAAAITATTLSLGIWWL